MSIGENIRRIRKDKKLTQKELGEKLEGISQQQIGQWENGIKIPKLETIQKIATALEIPMFDLINMDEYNNLIDTKVEEQIQNNIKSGKVHLVTEDEKELTANYLKLNTTGKTEARKRVHELTEIPRYTKPDEPPQE
jgi:transcriptional regulator with XRE-family HTH domain